MKEGFKLNYIKITPVDIANGPGCRTVLWVAGCSHHCKECHNPETWDENAGHPFNEKARKELINTLSKPFIRGITFSGGDPLYSKNVAEITKIAKYIKENMPQKDIWLYTGYTFEYVKEKYPEILKYIDVLVDGEFQIEKKNISLLFRGSSNQRLIKVAETLKSGKIVSYEQEKIN